MKEIVYIQAGSLSNHVGTHFWNTQESYFGYGEDAEDPIVNHDISFREGLSAQNEPTYCPRLLLFDLKSKFGALSKYNELYSEPTGSDRSMFGPAWNGPVAEFRQDLIPKSHYQENIGSGSSEGDDAPVTGVKTGEVRYWSDYNRVFYHPRSLHALSDLPEWEVNTADWNFGKGTFERYETENQLSEGDLRRFIEECDNFQGFQLTFDNLSFGAFSISMVEMIRDDFAKIPILAFPVLSGLNPTEVDIAEVPSRKTTLLDAICLQSLNELATQTIPIQSPNSWQVGRWSEHIDLDIKSLYETSAVLSTHVESATLPLRLKHMADGLSNLCEHLNWSQNTRFSHLSGLLPFVDEDDWDIHLRDFSAVVEPASKHDIQILAQRNVTRGLTTAQVHRTGEFFSKSKLTSPYLTNVNTIIYPIPTSYPCFFLPLPSHDSSAPPPKRAKPSTLPQPKSIPLLSSLTTTTATAALFHAHAHFLGECIRQRVGMGEGGDGVGLDADEVKEMRDALWAVADAYSGGEGSVSGGESDDIEVD